MDHPEDQRGMSLMRSSIASSMPIRREIGAVGADRRSARQEGARQAQAAQPWSQGRRGQIKNIRSIRRRPAEVLDREIRGHWEGDDIKERAYSANSIGALVERNVRFVILQDLECPMRRSCLGGLQHASRSHSQA
jgi:IS30 family transposase